MYRRRPPSRRRLILAAFVVASVVLITLDFNSGAKSSSLRKALLEVVRPVEHAVGTVTRPIGRFFAGLFDASELKRQNEELHRENEQLKREREDLLRVRRENAQLARLSNLQNPERFGYVTGRVIGVPATNSDWSISLDIGTKHGVADGNPVVTGEGLVGRVTNATSSASKVILLADPQMSVGVRDARSNVTGVVTGQGSNRLRLELVDASADVKPGDLLVTSGFDGSRFPAGIPVAKVLAVSKDKSGLVLAGDVEPLVDATKRDFISVLLWTPGG